MMKWTAAKYALLSSITNIALLGFAIGAIVVPAMIDIGYFGAENPWYEQLPQTEMHGELV